MSIFKDLDLPEVKTVTHKAIAANVKVTTIGEKTLVLGVLVDDVTHEFPLTAQDLQLLQDIFNGKI